MFASRANNENAIYEQQTLAAAKPLNQGVKGLAPKTPAGKPQKTPHRGGKNDENATSFAVGKGGAKEGKASQNAFVTPANARVRAPLGNKTTNAKTAFRTPVAPTTQAKPSSTKPTSPRLRRSKIKIHEAATEAAEDVLQSEDEEPEIEYMAPRGVPLPDYPDQDIWPHDREYPQLQGANFVGGCWSTYAPQKLDEYGHEVDELANFEEEWKKAEKLNKLREERERAALSRGNVPTTVKARDAVSALSSKSTNTNTARFSGPTSSAKVRQSATMAKRKASVPATVSNPRFAAAKVASKNTIGYSKGRQVSASARRPLSEVTSPPGATEEHDASKKDRSLADVLGFSDLHLDDDDEVPSLFSRANRVSGGPDDEEIVFQLDENDVL